jgi:ABC-2 type transport system ATP-binding protein
MPAIALDGVGKRYRLTDDDSLFVRQLAKTLTGRRAVREHWALRDIDLEVQAGESVGVIGRNGSGKTTMLRLLAGVSAPTVGRLRVEGSVAPLIGVGVGFNPELTGRENVFANGQILGLSKAQLTRDFDEIVAFAELEDFVQTPVKFYSSGMFLRLAFAVAIQVEPEVLLVDEILAVGDLAFQLKCLERMRQLRERGTTIVVVTHNLGSLNRMCDRAVVLSHGTKRFDGDVDGALGAYHEAMRDDRDARHRTVSLTDQEGSELLHAGGAEVTVVLRDAEGRPTAQVEAGADLEVQVTADVDHEVTDPIVGFAVGTPAYGNVYMAHTLPGEVVGTFGPGRPVQATVRLRGPLLEGSYHVLASLADGDGSVTLGTSRHTDFYVTTSARATGVVDLGAVVEVDGREVADLGAPGRRTPIGG